MNTFSVLLECVPFLGFVGFGLYFLLTALVPAWRERGWTHWKLFGTDEPVRENSWLVQLGFAKPTKPIAEGDFNEKSAILLYGILAALFISIGMGGLFVIVYRSIS